MAGFILTALPEKYMNTICQTTVYLSGGNNQLTKPMSLNLIYRSKGVITKFAITLVFIILANSCFAQKKWWSDPVDSFYWFHYYLQNKIEEKDTVYLFGLLKLLDSVKNNNTFYDGIALYSFGVHFPFFIVDPAVDYRGKNLWIERKNIMTAQRLFIKSECYLKLHGHSFEYIQNLNSYRELNKKLFDKEDSLLLISRINESCLCFMNIKDPCRLFNNIPDDLTKTGIEQLFYYYGQDKDLLPDDPRTLAEIKLSQNQEAIKKAREFIENNYKGQFEFLFLE